MNNDQFVAELSKLRTSSTFLALKGYHSKNGEIADFSIVFHISYKNALLRSIAALESIIPTDELGLQAKKECIESFMNSLNRIETIPITEVDDSYYRFTDSDGKYIKGVKLHKETNTLHLYGFIAHKRIIMPGISRRKNHRPLTIAKNKLRKLCPVSNFRQFKIDSNQVDSISVENISLLPPKLY